MAMSTYISFFLVLASLGITKLFYKNQGFFNPFLVFFGVWFLNLGLYEVDVSVVHYFSVSLSAQADKWLTISLLSFFMGGLIPFFLKNKIKTTQVITTGESKWIWLISLIFFVFYLVAVVYKYCILLKTYGNPISNLGKIRMDVAFGNFEFPFFLHFFTLPAYLLIINLGILTITKKSKVALLLSVITIALSFLDASAVGMRGGFLTIFLLFICSLAITYVACGKVITFRHMFILSLLLLCIIFVLAIPVYLRSNGRLTLLCASLAQNYIYFVGTLPSYSYFLANPWPENYFGMWTFMGLYQTINTLGNLVGHAIFNLNAISYYAPVISVGPFNSTNYLTYIFSDFGYKGFVIVPFLFGILANYFFIRSYSCKKIIDIQITALIFVGLITSVRGTVTFGVYCWVLIFLILLQRSFVEKITLKNRKI